MRKTVLASALLSLLSPALAGSFTERRAEDEVIYFLLPDRFENGDRTNDKGGLKGDRLHTGYDPTDSGFYHGGDLKGLVKRLDYIEGLGATAVWFAPIFKNKVIQGPKGQESAGYHGYWVTDFTTVDPHFGTEADFKAFVDAAHARGMKVYMDIITNHTADVIHYQECEDCTYRSRGDYPRDPAYTAIVDPAERSVKVPSWLNDPQYYNNRGNTHWEGESAIHGDFSGLDDVKTSDPAVVAGMIEIYASWIRRFKIDGFRIDTARHVDMSFWRAFVPAIKKVAAEEGRPNFHIFGEVATGDLSVLTAHTRAAGLPAVLDFGFRDAMNQIVGGKGGTDLLARVYANDVNYEGGAAGSLQLPTFVSNHDDGRLAYVARKSFPEAPADEELKRMKLAHAMLMLLRGVPVIYSGDEQGFAGGPRDRESREDMFPSKVPAYNATKLIGSKRTTADDNFDESHPLYQEITRLASIRKGNPALSRGLQVTRASGKAPGLFAVSRFDPVTGREIVLAFNSSTSPVTQNIEIEARSKRFTSLAGNCAPAARLEKSLTVTLEPLSYAVCAASED